MVRRTRGLDARIHVYGPDVPTKGDWLFPNRPFSVANPVGLWGSVAFLDEAREKRNQVTFRASGPDAEQAIEIVRQVLTASPEELEEGFIDVF